MDRLVIWNNTDPPRHWISLEAISKVPPWINKIDGSSSYSGKVFWPPAFGGIGASFQLLEIPMYSCGLKLGSASILNQNPFFEMASGK